MTAFVLVAWVAATAAGDAPPPVSYSRVTITERVIVRVPLPRRPARVIAPAPIWREARGPACITTDAVSGAAITAPASVDLILRGGARVRAKLDSDCPGLDYYSGFYLTPTQDGRICADRDAVRDRSGGSCEIDRFRALKPSRH